MFWLSSGLLIGALKLRNGPGLMLLLRVNAGLITSAVLFVGC